MTPSNKATWHAVFDLPELAGYNPDSLSTTRSRSLVTKNIGLWISFGDIFHAFIRLSKQQHDPKALGELTPTTPKPSRSWAATLPQNATSCLRFRLFDTDVTQC